MPPWILLDVVIASPKGAAISFFMGLLRRSAPRNDKLLIALVLGDAPQSKVQVFSQYRLLRASRDFLNDIEIGDEVELPKGEARRPSF